MLPVPYVDIRKKLKILIRTMKFVRIVEKDTYTFRTVNSIRKVFVGELKKKERNEE